MGQRLYRSHISRMNWNREVFNKYSLKFWRILVWSRFMLDTSRSQPQPSPARRFYNISDSSPNSPDHTDLNKVANSSRFGKSSSCQTHGTGPDLVSLVFSVSVSRPEFRLAQNTKGL